MVVESTLRFSRGILTTYRPLSLALCLSLPLLAACAQTGTEPTEQSSTAVSHPESDSSWAYLMESAASAQARGDYEGASALYRRAHDARPNSSAPLLGMAQLAEQINEPEIALEFYLGVLDINPTHRDANMGAGRALLALGQPIASFGHFSAVLGANGEDLEALNAFAIAKNSAGYHEEGKGYLRRALAVAPDDLRTLNNYGYALIETGHYSEAVAVFERLNSFPSASSKHRQNLAMAYVMADREGDARGVLLQDFDESSAERSLTQFRQMRTQ